ncbi:hypothetical protein U732_867 [Clostridium argentinense CDC 2741]|uniref:DUF1294 domain-containing protein n=1 Tax=Clostridium argentinense CDC 2741 TaxID=1418104 RepID=A0A0C1TVJ3_9CLOT|nr:DUF1294 domain-containing protein [Clostridium argentinense]ARC84325.1 hypothetical protein RSJ17_07140 [Clostridium argentinense]KIE44749.1 hypothetical protein U732_867 [Clostridium argentinense CDC 2741]NFF38288.1 DUF1294 domain-containing protein [Clostridium argentinense]NFP49127.1 DUF1294 domain-containing protein [Clostridium argentinense]NFP71593.1 DUF1294 domain-containing protein [Clostridium argentinense]
MLLSYLIIINLIGFYIMFLDKRKAKKHKWRISEKNIFLIALLGGSLGCLLGMNIFRHKTKHWYFKFGLPTILVLQVVAIIFFLKDISNFIKF